MSAALPDIPSPPTLCASVPAMLLFRTDLASGSPRGLPAVLRTSLIARSLVSRIWPYRVVLWTLFGPSVYGLSVYFQLLSTSPRGDAVTFSFWRKLHQRGTFTLLRTLTPKRTSADIPVRKTLMPRTYLILPPQRQLAMYQLECCNESIFWPLNLQFDIP